MSRKLNSRKAMSNFALGLGSCVALSGGFYNRTHRTIWSSDRQMVARDWFVVGSDMRGAASQIMNEVHNEHI